MKVVRKLPEKRPIRGPDEQVRGQQTRVRRGHSRWGSLCKDLGSQDQPRVRYHVGRWGNQRGLLWVSTALRALKNKVQSFQQIILTCPSFLVIYWPCHAACRILIPQPGIKSAPCALEAWSPNPWTAGEVLSHILSNGPRTIFLISPQETQSECLADNFILFFSRKSRLLFPLDFSSQRLWPSGRKPWDQSRLFPSHNSSISLLGPMFP